MLEPLSVRSRAGRALVPHGPQPAVDESMCLCLSGSAIYLPRRNGTESSQLECMRWANLTTLSPPVRCRNLGYYNCPPADSLVMLHQFSCYILSHLEFPSRESHPLDRSGPRTLIYETDFPYAWLWRPQPWYQEGQLVSLKRNTSRRAWCLWYLNRFRPALRGSLAFLLLIVSCLTILIAGLGTELKYDLKRNYCFVFTLFQLGVMLSLSLGMPELTFFHLLTHALLKALLFMDFMTQFWYS